jgi:hypothetical protein
MPFTGFDVFPDSRVQTVFIDDVAAAVVAAARGEVAGGTIADLTEPDSHSFGELVREMRSWLGLPSWQASIGVPGILIRASVKVADALGRIGWRSPLRSSAITVLGEGIHGDPSAWAKAGGRPCRALGETLAAMPATAQERWFARLYLLLPMIVGTLALFWILSGLIALARFSAAREVLTVRGGRHGGGLANLSRRRHNTGARPVGRSAGAAGQNPARAHTGRHWRRTPGRAITSA